MQHLQKLLIANRGEIAVRIAKTAEKMGISTVGIYAGDDSDSLHIASVREAFCLGIGDLKDTYLNGPEIIKIAESSGCDAIHPGYGFLSENPDFASLCKLNNLIFIGPSPEVIRLMGNKQEANKFVKSIGIPVLDAIPVSNHNINFDYLKLNFPLLIKAASGGGGKGMRIVHSTSELSDAILASSSEALNYFGEGTVYIEKLLKEPRHIEVQIIGDSFGNVVHLFERECSLQRRFQKVIEESPSVSVDDNLREKITQAALHIAKSVGYLGAGTIEFLLDKDGDFYFLEMNTRIQVEHRVTEMITGIDIVREQISVAMGNSLNFSQADINMSGHAIEARIYAEDPLKNFLPSAGTITCFLTPTSVNLLLDSGVKSGYEVKFRYDPLLAKLIVYGKTRNEAVSLLQKNLSEVTIHGITTNILFLQRVLEDRNYISNRISTTYIDKNLNNLLQSYHGQNEHDNIFFVAAALIIVLRNNKPSKPENNSIWLNIGLWRHLLILPLEADEIKKEVEITRKELNMITLIIENEEYLVNNIELKEHSLQFILNGIHHETIYSTDSKGKIWITCKNITVVIERNDLLSNHKNHLLKENDSETEKFVISPLYGKILQINVNENSEINKNDLVLIIDSMKTENRILAPCSGKIKRLHVSEGDQVETDMLLAEIE